MKCIWTSILFFLCSVSSFSLYEGDLSLNLSHLPSRHRRHVKRQKGYLWLQNVVPYEISPELNAYSALIFSAFEEFENKTCLTFVRREDWHDHYVIFQDGEICASSVGRIYWKTGPQFITLGKNCLNKVTIMHELMHTLGFLHEHTRIDRDKYIEILWGNIIEGEEKNFIPANIFLSDTVGMEYDLNSILHYDNMAYSANGKPTIQALSNPGLILGNKRGLSTNDVIKINKHYSCETDQFGTKTTSWGSWSPCNLDCVTYRQRSCHGEAFCRHVSKYDVQTQMRYCSTRECPAAIANGHWGVWSRWTKCHVGQQSRFRLCNNPMFGGGNCLGKKSEFRTCKNTELSIKPCFDSVGLENNKIPDDYLTSSFSLDNNTSPRFARLNNESCWCGAVDMLQRSNQFLQIKLLHSTKIRRLAIQGHPQSSWKLSSFRLLYKNLKNWMMYKEEHEPKIFRVSNKKSISFINLQNSIDAQYVAINPVSWNGFSPCLRLELYGCTHKFSSKV